MRLLVYWGPDDEADLQIPKEVIWEDGTPASLDDYYRNQTATQSSYPTEDGMVTVICPDVVAVARFDIVRERWVLEAPGGGPFALEQTDPCATDEDLKDEISSYPVAYQTTIDRSRPFGATSTVS